MIRLGRPRICEATQPKFGLGYLSLREFGQFILLKIGGCGVTGLNRDREVGSRWKLPEPETSEPSFDIEIPYCSAAEWNACCELLS